jgi:prepilin-type N-terminal cleavage/methylation domain-containing protein
MKTSAKNYPAVQNRGPGAGGKQNSAPSFSLRWPASRDTRFGFTLIELLAVIAIIGVLAAFTIPVFSAVKKQQYIKHTQAELALLETALERYKAAYGFYPPSNPAHPGGMLVNQLYYELEGTVTNYNATSGALQYQTLDGSATILASAVNTAFGIGGLMNCTKGSVEDTTAARNFLPDLKSTQFNIVTNPSPIGAPVTILMGSVGGPDPNYQPFGAPSLNPWRYNSASPTNNPAAYDLYMQLQISGKKYLICNWTKQVQINSPLP